MGETLNAGQSLKRGEQLVSSNGKFVLIMQPDGALALYQGAPSSGTAIWTANALPLRAWARPLRADMQNDGRLVLYHGAGFPILDLGMSGDHPNARLVLQDDGNLVIFDQHDNQLWTSNTSATAAAAASPVVEHESTYVGRDKYMDTTARLYRDGTLAIETYTRNEAWFEGLRGKVLVLCIDGRGNAHWISLVYNAPTRCAAGDPTCAHEGRSIWYEKFPEPVGQYTERLDIMQAEDPNYPDVRARLVDFIKATEDVVDAVKRVWDKLKKFP
jgi:hypothetical protein